MALRCLFGRRSLLVSAKMPQRKLGFCGGGFGGIPVRNHSDDPSVFGEKFHHPLGIHPRPSVSIYRDPEFSNDTFGAGGIKPYYGSLSDPLIIHASESAIRQYNRRQKKKLKLVGLLEASVQIVCGRKYYLTLEALDAGVVNKYKVEITRNASKKCAMELNSFNPVADRHET